LRTAARRRGFLDSFFRCRHGVFAGGWLEYLGGVVAVAASGRFLVSSVLWGPRLAGGGEGACLSSFSAFPARRLNGRGAWAAPRAGRLLRYRCCVVCRVGVPRRLAAWIRPVVLVVEEGEDDGGLRLCMAVPLRRPSRGLHLAGGDSKHRRCLNSLLLGLGWAWGWSAGFLLGACGSRRLGGVVV